MSKPHENPKSAGEIQSLLSGLRWRIRAYVWLEGICVALVWLGATFWASLAIDYLPVLAGANEMPRFARAILLVVIAGMFGWILYRWVLRRAFERFPDRSLAVLIERRFQQFHDSLVTSVELSQAKDDDFSAEMFQETVDLARRGSRDVRLSRVFNLRPLVFSMLAAIVLVMPIIVLYATNVSAWELVVNRLYLLGNEPWPRQAHIEVAGMEIQSAGAEEDSGGTQLRLFRNQIMRVARGSNLKLVVHAKDSAKIVPELCTVYYRTANGFRGTINMNRIGRPKDGVQRYEFIGPPFIEMNADITFDVLGYDHRVRDYQILAVDSPEVVSARLDCRFPDYMVDKQLSLWLPRIVDVTPGLRLPRGTHAILRATVNKDLQRVLVRYPDQDEVRVIDLHRDPPGGAEPGEVPAGGKPVELREFELDLGELRQDARFSLFLHDTDDVTSLTPHLVSVGVLDDRPPEVTTRLSGIGNMITPDATVPFRGKVEDDYGIARTWLEATVNDEKPTDSDVELRAGGQIEWGPDFREIRTNGGMTLKPKDKLVLQLKARDRYNLGEAANEGAGDRVELEVVTPDELLFDLEKKEIDKRRRLEQIIAELTETRDALIRVRSSEDQAKASSPEEAKQDADAATAEALDLRARALRQIRVQRAIQQSQKSSQETLGVAAGVRDICDELTNNRINTPDRKQRLEEQVADPLQQIGEQRFPELERKLQELGSRIERINAAKSPAAEADPLLDETVTLNNELLRKLDDVLQNMLDLESYNELLDIVRSLIDDQDKLLNETKKQQKKQALELLK